MDEALHGLQAAACEGANITPASIACAHAVVTTGEWAGTLREVFGEYRPPTGVAEHIEPADETLVAETRERAQAVAARLGRPIRLLVAKPGLDGHSNGAEQVALRARHYGLDVIYDGIRLTPAEITTAATEHAVDVIGLSILSGSHTLLIADITTRLRRAGLGKLPVVVGGIIPAADAEALKAAGVAAVYTPKDFELTAIIAAIVELVDGRVEKVA